MSASVWRLARRAGSCSLIGVIPPGTQMGTVEQFPSTWGDPPTGRPTATFAEVDIRAELEARPRRAARCQQEEQALARLTRAMAQHPRHMLHTFAEVAVDACEAETAGVSLLDGDIFRWEAVAGVLAGARGRTMPRTESACGVCIDCDATLLMRQPDRCYPALFAEPRMVEALFVPFRDHGTRIGTVWIASHTVERTFDREDERLLRVLAQVVSVGRQLWDSYDTGVQRRIPDDLRRSEAYLAEGQRISHTGTWAVNPLSGDIYWSEEMFRIYALDPRKTTPRQSMAFQLIHPEDRAFVEEAFETSLRNKSDYAVEHRALVHGTIKYLHALGHPVLNAQGELVEYVGTVVDVTERKQAEERIRERERRFRLLADAIPHHVWSYSPDGDLSYWNQQILDYTGLTPDQLQQGGWVIVHPDDLDRVKRAWREACDTQTPYELEQRLRGRDGGYRRFLYRAVPMRDDDGRLVAWYSTNTDVEEQRAAEEALRETQTKLAHLTRMMAVGELSASLAHELNQPLAAIVANGAAAMRWLDNNPPCIDEATTALHRLIRDAHRAGDVIRHARALLKKSTTSHIPVDLRETLQEVLVLVQPEMTAHGILTHESHTLDLPRVLGAPVELQQLALNLILNALEAMAPIKDRRRELLIRCEQGRLHDGPGVLVSVQDTGGGVHPDAFDRLFEPLFTTKSGGLGLGLSICRTIVDAHGGILWAENNAGQGATFRFLLPACNT